jgi:phospholipase C
MPTRTTWYTAGVLNALTSNPEVWSKTALIITFDENDGFFDHVPGPYPNVGGLPGTSTVHVDNEFFAGQPGTPKGSAGVPGPYGLGIRVPLLVVSPWSSGGWVCSETFDHSSLIRFIEARLGIDEPNITPWRRAVCGDLTSAFDFESSSQRVPRLPSVAGYKPNESTTPPSYHPLPPAVGRVPTQEPGVRPSRRLGYRFDVDCDANPQALNVAITNRGELGVGLQARSLTVPGAPYTHTIGAGDELTAALSNPGTYDLSLVETHADHRWGRLTLRIADAHRDRRRKRRLMLEVADAYGPDRKLELRGDGEITIDTGHAGG